MDTMTVPVRIEVLLNADVLQLMAEAIYPKKSLKKGKRLVHDEIIKEIRDHIDGKTLTVDFSSLETGAG